MGNLYWCYVIISVLSQCERGAKSLGAQWRDTQKEILALLNDTNWLAYIRHIFYSFICHLYDISLFPPMLLASSQSTHRTPLPLLPPLPCLPPSFFFPSLPFPSTLFLFSLLPFPSSSTPSSLFLPYTPSKAALSCFLTALLTCRLITTCLSNFAQNLCEPSDLIKILATRRFDEIGWHTWIGRKFRFLIWKIAFWGVGVLARWRNTSHHPA